MEIPLGPENTGSTHKAMGTPSRHFVTWQLMEVPQCFFFCFQMLVFSLCCLQNRFFFQSIGGWMMMLNVILVSSQSSLWIGWLCVILPAIHSQRVKALTSGWVTKLASLTKKLRFPAQPVWSRMQDLFTLITQIEVKQIKTNFLSLVGRHNFKGLPYIMSPLKYKASRNAENLRHFVKEH